MTIDKNMSFFEKSMIFIGHCRSLCPVSKNNDNVFPQNNYGEKAAQQIDLSGNLVRKLNTLTRGKFQSKNARESHIAAWVASNAEIADVLDEKKERLQQKKFPSKDKLTSSITTRLC